MKIFIDTCVPMYAAGKEHPMKQGCLDVLHSAAQSKIEAYTDTEVLQEILYRYYHIKQRQIGFKVFDLFATIMEGSILPVLPADIFRARLLAEDNTAAKLSPRDLIHLAVMSNNGIAHIITADKGFKAIPGIQVISPF